MERDKKQDGLDNRKPETNRHLAVERWEVGTWTGLESFNKKMKSEKMVGWDCRRKKGGRGGNAARESNTHHNNKTTNRRDRTRECNK